MYPVSGCQMSRKRPASAVTCHDEGSLAADLREWSFSCFMLVPVDEVGSPRKVPENSQLPWLTDVLPVLLDVGQHGGAGALRWRSALFLRSNGRRPSARAENTQPSSRPLASRTAHLCFARGTCLLAYLGVPVQLRRAASAFRTIFAAWSAESAKFRSAREARLRNSAMWSARVSCLVLVRRVVLWATVGSLGKGAGCAARTVALGTDVSGGNTTPPTRTGQAALVPGGAAEGRSAVADRSCLMPHATREVLGQLFGSWKACGLTAAEAAERDRLTRCVDWNPDGLGFLGAGLKDDRATPIPARCGSSV